MKNKTIDDGDLRDLLINPKLNNRGQYICDCPFCNKPHHFYINKQTQLWDCKKCNEAGNIYKLLRFLNKTYLLGEATVEYKETLLSIKNSIESETEPYFDVNDIPIKKMPVGYKIISKNDYLTKIRNIPLRFVKRYKLGETKLLSKYKNYILVPIPMDGKIRGFLGRYAAKKVPSGILRYNNSKDTNFADLLYGYDDISSLTHTVIIVEGIFDKIAVDRLLNLFDSPEIKCVCTFGKKISDNQISLLKQKNILNCILLYDFDAVRDIKKYSIELEKNFFTYITFTTHKDIDECPEDEARKVFDNLLLPRFFNENIIQKIK